MKIAYCIIAHQNNAILRTCIKYLAEDKLAKPLMKTEYGQYLVKISKD